MTDELVDDPREGHGVLALWDYVYDFDDDIGGFVTGQFLLRDDGVLWMRNGGSRWSGGTVRYEFRGWHRWTLEPGPFDAATAFATVSRRHYTVYAPGPTPIDASRSGPFQDDAKLRNALPAGDAGLWTAPRRP